MARFHCKGLRFTTEMCLNCPYKDCVFDGRASAAKSYDNRPKYESGDYIIKRTYRSLYGGVRTSYVTGAGSNMSSADINKAMKLSEKAANAVAEIIRPKVSSRTTLTIVRKDEELEKITKDNNVDNDSGDNCSCGRK